MRAEGGLIRAMTTIHIPSEADLRDRDARLLAGPKLVLRLKSLVFLPTGKAVFVDCLARSGLRAPGGRAWSSRSVNAVLEQMLGEGLLTEDLACPRRCCTPWRSMPWSRLRRGAAFDPAGDLRERRGRVQHELGPA